MNFNLHVFLSAVWGAVMATFRTDTSPVLLQALLQFNTSLLADNSPLGLAIALGGLQQSILSLGPKLKNDELKAINNVLVQFIAQTTASAATPAAPTATS